jgi:hypothetical protein
MKTGKADAPQFVGLIVIIVFFFCNSKGINFVINFLKTRSLERKAIPTVDLTLNDSDDEGEGEELETVFISTENKKEKEQKGITHYRQLTKVLARHSLTRVLTHHSPLAH